MISPAYSEQENINVKSKTREAENSTAASSAATSEDDPACVLELATPGRDMFEEGSAVVRECKGALPQRTGSKDENVVADALARRQNDGSAGMAFFSLFDGSDATDLDGPIVVDKKTVVGNENVVLEFSLGSGGHADGRREVKGERTRSYESKGCRTGIDLCREDACDGRTGCATTHDNDALAVSLRHCISGEGRRM